MDITTERSADALRIPTRAFRYHTPPSGGILSAQSLPFVWVAEPIEGETDRYTVREVQVKVGISDRATMEILSGLKAGQKVVVAGQDYLKNGDTVSEAGSQAAASEPVSAASLHTNQDMPTGMNMVPKRQGGAR
jgi:hypothetical protein